MLRFRGFGGFRVSGIHFVHSLVVARLLPSHVAATKKKKVAKGSRASDVKPKTTTSQPGSERKL